MAPLRSQLLPSKVAVGMIDILSMIPLGLCWSRCVPGLELSYHVFLLCSPLFILFATNRESGQEDLVGEGAETVEPILNSFGGYSTDNLSNFYFPYIIVLLMIFREQASVEHVDRVSLGRRKFPATSMTTNFWWGAC